MQSNTNTKNGFKGFLLNRLKALAGAFVFVLFFSLVLMKKLNFEWYLATTLLTYVQLELFYWLGVQFFKSSKLSPKRIKAPIIIRLTLFYLTVLIIALLVLLLVYFIQYLINGYDFDIFFSQLISSELKPFFTTLLIGFALGALFFFFVLWSEALKREKQLEQEKLIFQYETLKNQLDPHFLFNSLNTLSSLVRTNPDLSEEFIQKLSLVYRYILENHEKLMVPVSDEIHFVQEYFFLRKIRDEEKIDLQVNLGGTENALILPVSLQLLVENALKHNSATRNNPLVISIHNEGNNKLVVHNNLQKKPQINDSSKIGLKNLNERCRLILSREIEIIQTENDFSVKIPVKEAFS